MPLKALFDSRTVAPMAVVIVRNQAKNDQENLERMPTELEDLSEEEAERRLEEAGTRRSRADGHE